MTESTGNPTQDVARAVWSELNKRRWFGKHVEDEEIEALETDMHEAIRKALETWVS
jgi:hypothetical protein